MTKRIYDPYFIYHIYHKRAVGVLLTGFLFLLSSCQGGHKQDNGDDSTAATAQGTVKTGASGKMPIDCTVCKEPSRAGLLMGSGNDSANNTPATGSAVAGVSADGSAKDTAAMVHIKAGQFKMGSMQFPDAQPVHQVKLKSYYIDAHEVTNDQFARFVEATHYITVAERPLDPKDYPGVPVDKLVPGSGVFTPPNRRVNLNNPMQWWSYVPGANWRNPRGPSSNIKGKGHFPVVQVCYEDCEAYAKWAGKRLPTEAEWEFAAKAGQDFPNYYWGKTLTQNGHYMANNFQGEFPHHNTLKDGFATLAPTCTFPASAYGLYDMEGNAWEWCSDFYRPDYYKSSSAENPQGPASSYDPEEPGVTKRVQRGGSFLCSDEYCIRYKAGARGKGEPTSASNNLGFRCVRDE